MCALKLSAFTPTIGTATATATISWRLSPTHCNFFYDFTKRPRRTMLTRLKPSCSLKETQTKIQKHKVSSVSPRLESSEPPSDGEPAQSSESPDDNPNNAALAEGKGEGFFDGDTALKGTLLAGLVLVAVVGGLGSVALIYKDQLNAFLIDFSRVLEGYGPAGYALFVAVYAGLEILAIPAVPLTMSAGLLFGNVTGTIIVSVSGTIAATISFLIARYFARERIAKLVEGNKKFAAIDKAIGENGFRVVTLLRLSPLLPFSLGNYLYGLTSVQLFPYVLGRILQERHPTLFWSPCAAHVLDLLLEDIGKLDWVSPVVEDARRVTKYIYNRPWVLSLMRKATKGKDLMRPSMTRFATVFLTLQSILDHILALKQMFVCADWVASPYSKNPEGEAVAQIVFDDSFFAKAKEIVEMSLPLVLVLRICDGQQSPMGGLYEAMDRAKEAVRSYYHGDSLRFDPIWEIIDRRWNNMLHQPIYVAGYFLNPKFSWLGMLPGTWAYVSAGAFGRAFIQEEAEGGLPGGNEQLLTLGLGLLVTAVAATYVTRLAKDAVKDIE